MVFYVAVASWPGTLRPGATQNQDRKTVLAPEELTVRRETTNDYYTQWQGKGTRDQYYQVGKRINPQSDIVAKRSQKLLTFLPVFPPYLDFLQSWKRVCCFRCVGFVTHLPQKVPDLKHMEKDGSVFAGFSGLWMCQKS